MSPDDSVGQYLPQYSPPVESPKYSAEPGPDECRLQITRRIRREESGVFVEKTKHMTIALTNQVPDCKVPTYSRAATVQGVITFVKPDNLTQVEVKLCGNINLSVASAVISGEQYIQICDETELLYRKDINESDTKRTSLFSRGSSTTPITAGHLSPKFSGQQCPVTLVFTLQFPITYQHEGIARALPPSYIAQFGIIPGISLSITYALRVTTVRRSSLGDKRSTSSVFLEYIPRSRPAQPSLPLSMTFLSSLKSAPEEWEMYEDQAQPKRNVAEEIPQLYVAFAIPKSRIFPLTQPVPFHLQLLSPFEELLSPYNLTLSSTPADKKSKNEAAVRTATNEPLGEVLVGFSRMKFGSNVPISGSWSRVKPRISVSIERNVSTETHGEWVTTKQILTTQQLVPSSNCMSLSADKDVQMKCLAWDGELRFKDEYHCGAFFGPCFRVKDFLVLTVYPPDPESSPMRPFFYSIPIRLSTDPYTDEIIAGMELIQSAPPISGRS